VPEGLQEIHDEGWNPPVPADQGGCQQQEECQQEEVTSFYVLISCDELVPA
jgi:hypothetical protein